MKKSLAFVLLSLTTTSLVGCNQADPVDPSDDDFEVVDIEIAGDLKKKNYEYEDKWDFTGLVINGIDKNDKKLALKSTEYKLTPSVDAPKKLGSSLSLTVKYNKKKTISDSKIFKDIFVADEKYNEEEEIAEYYADCNTELSGSSLMNELHRHSFEKHTTFVTYGDVKKYIAKESTSKFDSTDLVPGVHNTEYFYTGALSNYNVGTKEHVWACNDSAGLWVHNQGGESNVHNVDNVNYIGGGSDLYHVRPSGSKTNTARGDAPFVEFADFSYKPLKNINYDDSSLVFNAYKFDYVSGDLTYADYVEPPKQYKGDIARIVAYVYMHYHTNTNTPADYKYMTGNLDLKKVIGYQSDAKCISILKKWNKLDPPSDVEKHRNHVVEQIQGNRNPFVDDSTLLDKMFD